MTEHDIWLEPATDDGERENDAPVYYGRRSCTYCRYDDHGPITDDPCNGCRPGIIGRGFAPANDADGVWAKEKEACDD